MQTIQNAMRRFFVILHLAAIKNVGLRLCKRKPITKPVLVVLPPMTEEIEASDANDLFEEWEDARSETLKDANDCERQALHLLSKASLLRVAVSCDDRGDGVLAGELRARAEEVVVLEANDNQPTLRVVSADTDTPF